MSIVPFALSNWWFHINTSAHHDGKYGGHTDQTMPPSPIRSLSVESSYWPNLMKTFFEGTLTSIWVSDISLAAGAASIFPRRLSSYYLPMAQVDGSQAKLDYGHQPVVLIEHRRIHLRLMCTSRWHVRHERRAALIWTLVGNQSSGCGTRGLATLHLWTFD